MSRSFKDSSDTCWHVSFSVSVARLLLRGEEPIDILDAKQLAGAFDNPFHRFALLWAACETQAKEQGIESAEAFDAWLIPADASPQETERVWAESETALREALVDFFQRIGQKTLAQVITRTIEARKRLDGVAAAKLEGKNATDLIEHAALKAAENIDEQLETSKKALDLLGKTSTN